MNYIKDVQNVEKGFYMRDIDRIDKFLEEIGKIWKDFPDWRFGQLIENLRRFKGSKEDKGFETFFSSDLFHLEEKDFLKLLKEFRKDCE